MDVRYKGLLCPSTCWRLTVCSDAQGGHTEVVEVLTAAGAQPSDAAV